jgi:Fe2+ transport system protein B
METAITLIIPPELNLADELKAELSALVQARLEETKTLTVVSTDEQFQAAGEQVKAIAQLRSRLESVIRPYVDFWHRGHKAHTQLLATLDGPLDARERSIKQGLARYQREKEEARRREEERLRREAEELRRKLEEEDRKRREMEAEAAKRKLEEEALAEASAREADGDHETATLILNHAVEQVETLPEPVPSVPIVFVAPVAQATAPKVRGVGFREVPKWRMKCGHEKADDPKCPTCQSVPREYLVLDPRRVQARVNGFGINANIPGVEVWMEPQTSVRRKP